MPTVFLEMHLPIVRFLREGCTIGSVLKGTLHYMQMTHDT